MSLQSTLAMGQARWLAIAGDTCRITKSGPGGRGEMDPDTLQYPDEDARVTVYEGPCRVQVKVDINSNVVETTAGDREWTYLISQLQLPVFAPTDHPDYVSGAPSDVDVDHVCDLLTSNDSPALAGAKFNIAGPFHKSQAVYLRFRVKEPVG